MNTCKHTNPDDYANVCGRKVSGISDFCEFHIPNNAKEKMRPREFVGWLLQEYHNQKNGNWTGFEFPDGVRLENLEIDYPLDLRWVKFGRVTFQNVHFKSTTNFSHCRFDGELILNSTFDAETKFEGCEFAKQALFLGRFNEPVSFNNSTFYDAVTFLGGRDIVAGSTISVKVRRLFHNVVSMENMYFLQPTRTKFMGVDLVRAHLVGTDMKGVFFYDVNWFQKKLGRQGLQDEVSLITTSDKEFQKYLLPRIEAQYRNIRVALEENKDYSTATDFYIGEMNTRRRQLSPIRRHLFSIETVYDALSLYGSSIRRAIRFMGYLIILHTLLTWHFLINSSAAGTSVFKESLSSWSNMIQTGLKILINSLKVLTLQREGYFIELTSGQTSLDTIFRVIGPIQIALIVLAMRARIKRH